jgi:hypothetical protein
MGVDPIIILYSALQKACTVMKWSPQQKVSNLTQKIMRLTPGANPTLKISNKFNRSFCMLDYFRHWKNNVNSLAYYYASNLLQKTS